jgi:hypothetical protein
MLVTRQVVANRPSHMAGPPRGPASTDFRLQIPCYRLLEGVIMKLTHERLQSGVGRPGGLADRPALGPIGQRPLHNVSSYQVHSRVNTYFGGIPIFLVIS